MPLPMTWPMTVKPEFCTSKLLALLPRLIKNCEVALSGSPDNLAMATVPRRLDSSGSLVTPAPVEIASGGKLLAYSKPPIWIIKPGTLRCTTLF